MPADKRQSRLIARAGGEQPSNLGDVPIASSSRGTKVGLDRSPIPCRHAGVNLLTNLHEVHEEAIGQGAVLVLCRATEERKELLGTRLWIQQRFAGSVQLRRGKKGVRVRVVSVGMVRMHERGPGEIGPFDLRPVQVITTRKPEN